MIVVYVTLWWEANLIQSVFPRKERNSCSATIYDEKANQQIWKKLPQLQITQGICENNFISWRFNICLD